MLPSQSRHGRCLKVITERSTVKKISMLATVTLLTKQNYLTSTNTTLNVALIKEQLNTEISRKYSDWNWGLFGSIDSSCSCITYREKKMTEAAAALSFIFILHFLLWNQGSLIRMNFGSTQDSRYNTHIPKWSKWIASHVLALLENIKDLIAEALKKPPSTLWWIIHFARSCSWEATMVWKDTMHTRLVCLDAS